MTAMVMPRKTVKGDRVRIKPQYIANLRSAFPTLTKDTVFEVTGEVGAYEKRTLAVVPQEGLPNLIYAGTTIRAWAYNGAREKALRAAGHNW